MSTPARLLCGRRARLTATTAPPASSSVTPYTAVRSCQRWLTLGPSTPRAVPLTGPLHTGRSVAGAPLGAMRPTALRRAPHFPPSAPASSAADMGKDALATPLARELTLLSRDDFGRRVFRFSRLNFDAQDRPVVHTYLMVLLAHRLPTATPKQVMDYIHLAHVAGFHELCVKLFEARQRAETAGHVALASAEERIVPSEFVVDSAYACCGSAQLRHLAASAALQRMEAETEAAAAATATVAAPSSARAVQASFIVVRCLWRAVCLHCHFEALAATAVSTAAAAHQADADRAADDALHIYTSYIQPRCSRAHPLSTSSAAAVTAEGDVKATEEREAASRQATTPHEAARVIETPAWEPARLLRRLRRLVLYDDSGDDGEMLFYQLCLSEGWLCPPLDAASARSTDAGTEEAAVTPEATTAAAASREFFYSLLIATCTVGRHVGAAMAYLDAVTCAAVPDTLAAGWTGAVHAAAARPLSLVTDQVPWRLVMVLQGARENRLTVRLARRLVRHACPLGISVWSLILISAGETRASDVALHGYRLARHRLQLDGSEMGMTNSSGDGGSTVPSLGGVAGGDGSQHGWEYLLQTSLNALSKCQVPDFEQAYLAPCVEDGALHCTDDFYYGCLLQEAHNALNPAERAEALLARMATRGVPLSAGLISRLLKLYLRVESPAFLPIYQHAVDELGLYRPAWRDELLLWADRRRYMLSAAQRAYVLEQIAEHTPTPVRDHLGGLRTQYALLEYDARVQPLEVFAQTHTPPAEGPTIMDSRMHFLLKKPQLVRQGVQHLDNNNSSSTSDTTTTTTGSAVASVSDGRTRSGSATPHLVGTPNELARAVEAVVLTRTSPLTSAAAVSSNETVAGAYRLYLGDLVEGLQRSNNSLP